MLRIIGAVVLGYLVMVAVIFVCLSAVWYAFGADGAFQPGSYQVSTLWIAATMVVNIGAALVGGWLAARVARSPNGPRALAGAVLLIGLGMALPVLLGGPAAAAVRPDGVPMFEAIAQAQSPVWVLLLTPIAAALAVLVGGGALGRGGVRQRRVVQFG